MERTEMELRKLQEHFEEIEEREDEEIDCLIEFATDDGTAVRSGYGEDH